jgi:hypothetical protein
MLVAGGRANPRNLGGCFACCCDRQSSAGKAQWSYTRSIEMIRALIGARMFALTLEGLDAGMRQLSR